MGTYFRSDAALFPNHFGHTCYYFAPVGERSIAISFSVCLSVCLCVCPRAYLWNSWTDLHEICCADPMWPWLSRRCDMLCTSFLWMTSRLAVVSRMFMNALLLKAKGPGGRLHCSRQTNTIHGLRHELSY